MSLLCSKSFNDFSAPLELNWNTFHGLRRNIQNIRILKLWFAYKHIYETYINIFKNIYYIYINIYTSLTIVKYGYFEYFFWGHGRYFNLILKVLRSHWRILNIRVTWSNLRCKLLFRSLYGELPQSLSVLWRWLLGSVNWKNAQPKSWELCLIQQTYWRHKLGRWPLT